MIKQYTFLHKPLLPPTLENSNGRMFGDFIANPRSFISLEDSQAMEKLSIRLSFPLSPS